MDQCVAINEATSHIHVIVYKTKVIVKVQNLIHQQLAKTWSMA